jgi:hypothetical protein
LKKKLTEKSSWIWSIVILGGIPLVIYILWRYLVSKNAFDKTLLIHPYEIGTAKINRPVTLVLLTDLHNDFFGTEQNELVKAIQTVNPDIILMAGDMIDRKFPLDGFLALIRNLPESVPAFFVTGNNDFWKGYPAGIKTILRDHGVNVLEGECVLINVKNQMIDVCGIDDPKIGKKIYHAQISSAGEQKNSGCYSILLMHRPDRRHLNEVLPYHYDLILSGHAHGGQWRIPGLVNGLIAPDQGIFPRYTGGLYQHGETNQIVSRGLAKNSSLIPRIFNRPELVVIQLLPDKR